MTARRACLACRIRKVKCTPATPRCVRCEELKIDECLYISTRKRGAGGTLRMGGACQRCRKRKRRCDAKQPCTACIQFDGGADCAYEQGRAIKRTHDNLPVDAQPFLSSFECVPNPAHSPSPWMTNEYAALSASDISSPVNGTPPSVSTNQTLYRLSPEDSCFTESDTQGCPDSPTPWENSSPEMRLALFREDSPKSCQPNGVESTFSFLPSLHFAPVPRPLFLSFPLMNPEYFQISDTTSSELDLTFRIAALLRLRQFGIYLPGPKQAAIIQANTSNTVVHPFFTHATAGLGMHFRANTSSAPDAVRLHAKYGQLAWEQIAEISKKNDAYLKAQIYLLTATAALYGRWFDFCRQYLTKACIALNASKLRFLPAAGRPPDLTEDTLEKLAVLSQNIYFENYMFLAVDRIEPGMTARIEKEFRNELQQAYPQLLEICPLTMRTQAILLIKDVILTMCLHPTKEANPGQWKRISDEAVGNLREYSKTLLRNVRQFMEIGDAHGAEIIQHSCIGCLAHLAALCDHSAQLEPNSKPQMDAVCDWSLKWLGDLTQGTRSYEYTYLDLLLKISWERSLAVFDSRICYLPHEESALLRRHQETVKEAWSDFKTKLPDESPLSITTLLVFVDGRQEGSNYPNFMLASERWNYGL